jgi:hypothetical protein
VHRERLEQLERRGGTRGDEGGRGDMQYRARGQERGARPLLDSGHGGSDERTRTPSAYRE